MLDTHVTWPMFYVHRINLGKMNYDILLNFLRYLSGNDDF